MKHTVTIVYASGAKVRLRCKSFTLTRNPTSGAMEIKWEGASPRPLYAGVDHIQAVYHGRA